MIRGVVLIFGLLIAAAVVGLVVSSVRESLSAGRRRIAAGHAPARGGDGAVGRWS